MPKVIQFFTNFVPAKYFLVILRGIFLKGNGWAILFKETLVLLFFGILLIGAAALKFKKKLE
jgi:ABC-2 type transport system permease protein